MSWSVERLTFRYPATAEPAIDGIDLAVSEGGFTAILGPNGSGKSTLLRLLLGVLHPQRGAIRFRGRPLDEWTRQQLALEIGVVPQDEEMPFPMTVRDLVAMGRYPHLGAWRREGRRDAEAIDRALERCDVARLAGRLTSTLSGGERQRARVARALAQEPRVLALDEPTLALDVRHEMTIFELLRELGAAGVTVLVITHNLNLAARYADRLVLLDRGRVAAGGSPLEVIRSELLERVYGWPITVASFAGPGRQAGAPQATPLEGGAPAPGPAHSAADLFVTRPTHQDRT